MQPVTLLHLFTFQPKHHRCNIRHHAKPKRAVATADILVGAAKCKTGPDTGNSCGAALDPACGQSSRPGGRTRQEGADLSNQGWEGDGG